MRNIIYSISETKWRMLSNEMNYIKKNIERKMWHLE